MTTMPDVLILAAGRGERLIPLTDSTPKPMLQVGDKTLLEHHLDRLKQQGFHNVVINLAWLGKQIQAHIGDGTRFGLQVHYSPEPEGALESGGGIVRALQLGLIQSDPFIVINGDILCDFNYADLRLDDDSDIHLIMVSNPPDQQDGDFGIEHGHLTKLLPTSATADPLHSWTYSGIGCFRHCVFDQPRPERFPLLPIIERSIADNRISAEVYEGEWWDIGTAERLAQARESYTPKD